MERLTTRTTRKPRTIATKKLKRIKRLSKSRSDAQDEAAEILKHHFLPKYYNQKKSKQALHRIKASQLDFIKIPSVTIDVALGKSRFGQGHDNTKLDRREKVPRGFSSAANF